MCTYVHTCTYICTYRQYAYTGTLVEKVHMPVLLLATQSG